MDEIASSVFDRLSLEISTYQVLDAESVTPGLAKNIDVVLAACLPGFERVSRDMLLASEASGAERESQGVPIEDLLRGWRVGLETTFDHARTLAIRERIPETLVVEFLRALLHGADVAMSATAAGHRRSELQGVLATMERRTRLVRHLLFQEGSNERVAEQLQALGIEPTASLRAFCTSSDATSRSEADAWLNPPTSSLHVGGASAVAGSHVVGFVLVGHTGTPPGLIGLGPAVQHADLRRSLAVARRVFAAAQAAGRTGACQLEHLGVLPAIFDDAEVGDILLARYIDPVVSSRAGESILDTVDEYFRSRQNIEAVSREAFVHVNTVRYRLQRFEELTGSDLRDVATLSEVHWALARRAMLRRGSAAARGVDSN